MLGETSLNKTNDSDSWLTRRVQTEIKDLENQERSHPLVAIAGAVFLFLIVIYFISHQLSSTGFFTTKFGLFEIILLYGSLFEWIVVAILEALGRKNISRDIDAFGGIIFVVVGGIWLFFVFPFDFAYLGEMLPNFLRFSLQWISNDIGRIVIVLWIIVNGIAAVYYFAIRVSVRKEMKRGRLLD